MLLPVPLYFHYSPFPNRSNEQFRLSKPSQATKTFICLLRFVRNTFSCPSPGACPHGRGGKRCRIPSSSGCMPFPLRALCAKWQTAGSSRDRQDTGQGSLCSTDLSRVCTSRACFHCLNILLLHLRERFCPPFVDVECCGFPVAGRAWHKQSVIIFLALSSGSNDHHHASNMKAFALAGYVIIPPAAEFARDPLRRARCWMVVLLDASQIHISLCTR